MSHGFFTQSACILLRGLPSLDAVRNSLAKFDVVRNTDPAPTWVFGGPGLLVSYRPQVNGLVLVDLVDRPWPDSMGNPQAENGSDKEIFGGWATGQFGPYTFPGGLSRAADQSWAWEPGRTVAGEHQAFIRVRSSYVLGKDGDAPILPPDADALDEIEHVTSICQALLTLPEAICYFNPNGEVLRDAELLANSIELADHHELPSLDIWSNIRLFRVNDDWQLMDTVGNNQLNLPDIEAVFDNRYDLGEVDNFLRNISLFLLNEGDVIRTGDLMDGPGETRWQATKYKDGISVPPREVVCWRPLDESTPPREFTQRETVPDEGPISEAGPKKR